MAYPWIFETGGYDDWPETNPIHLEFCEAVIQMNVDHPGISDRVFSLNRTYDSVHYLISEDRRRENHYNRSDLGSMAVLGDIKLPAYIHGGQGHTSGYNSPDVVQDVADWMRGITMELLRPYFDPVAMDETVYKFASHLERSWENISDFFNGFKAFYLVVAAHGDAVLVVVT